MKRRLQKELVVENIKEHFQKTPFLVFFDYSSCSNNDIFLLKRKLKKNQGFWKVYKNKLVSKAISEIGSLKHNNALIFCSNDESIYIPILKTLNEFSEVGGKKNRIVGMFSIEKNFISDPDLIKKWSNLPTKKVLISLIITRISLLMVGLIKLLEKIALVKKF